MFVDEFSVWLYTLFLFSIRIAVVFFMTPLLGISRLPKVVTGLLSIGLSAVLVNGAIPMASMVNSLSQLLFSVLSELLTGLALGFSIHILFSALAFAGRLIDSQMSFGLAGVLDLFTRQSGSLSGFILKLLAVAYIYAINGHYLILEAVINFTIEHPVGSVFNIQMAELAVVYFSKMFLLAITLAAPLVIALFILDIAIALIARTMPQMNVFIVSLPAKVMLGVAILIVLVPRLGSYFNQAFVTVIRYMDQ